MSWFFSSSSSSSSSSSEDKFNADVEQLVKSKAQERETLRVPVIQGLQTRFEKIARGSEVWVLDWDMREGLFTAQIGYVHDRLTDGVPDNLTALFIDDKAYKLSPLTTCWSPAGCLASSVTKMIIPRIMCNSNVAEDVQKDHAVIRSLVSPYIVLFKYY